MKITSALIAFLLLGSGCSLTKPTDSSNLITELVKSEVPQCSLILNSQTTYWSKFEGGSIHLFVGEAKTKCLLR